ncbi:winged helix-turn-helix transcriptional regulator [Paenibacillus sp. SYP-B3998]|uniref:Winged helix-turn-helix transcriptional regulator n=2 Tax=Paenibacillus sp. SYP-B3998 TaxID=2678564 RepID=A0A6G3ZTV7_9BACL|nr:winged helix-turn-helix domain-containing protein [Paenibacillus sp. SYP-B3998]NEW05021.1 winged helix-turn-helix transcriptional regulator [Paenibacillus sp. SYP-B3998]
MNSLHTYICRKSHKKIDLTSSWAKETRKQLTPDLVGLLDQVEVDNDWKLTYLLVHLCPDKRGAEPFLTWLESLTPGDLYELIAAYSNQFPTNMAVFRSRTLSLFTQWNEQYFRQLDSAIIHSLSSEQQARKEALPVMTSDAFVDETTNGLLFKPMKGLEELILIPQYHFQPINVICYFGRLTLCNYSARIYFSDEETLSPHAYRMIKSLAEMSRLKILRYLHHGPRSFIEIVRHLKLSKGITHDHISKLRSAGLIHAHFEGETLTEYSLRAGALQHMHNKLLGYIEQR